MREAEFARLYEESSNRQLQGMFLARALSLRPLFLLPLFWVIFRLSLSLVGFVVLIVVH